MAGNVVATELKEDKDGNSRGMGVIKFDHPMEAVQAISMFHNQVDKQFRYISQDINLLICNRCLKKTSL